MHKIDFYLDFIHFLFDRNSKIYKFCFNNTTNTNKSVRNYTYTHISLFLYTARPRPIQALVKHSGFPSVNLHQGKNKYINQNYPKINTIIKKITECKVIKIYRRYKCERNCRHSSLFITLSHYWLYLFFYKYLFKNELLLIIRFLLV